jgi:hypothetical protein
MKSIIQIGTLWVMKVQYWQGASTTSTGASRPGLSGKAMCALTLEHHVWCAQWELIGNKARRNRFLF